MKKLLLCLSLFIVCGTAFSQKVYFLYLQSENNQAFYVKMADKVYSSAASGYVILSKLRDSTYKFNVGFPDNKWPEQSFTVVINKKDHGYLLKNFEAKGWGLFDLQNMSVQMSATGSAKVELPKDPALLDNSLFTDVLAKAADDPSIREKREKPMEEKKAIAVADVKKEEPKKEEPKKAEEKVVKIEPVKTPEVKEEVKQAEIKEAEVVKTEPAPVVNEEEYKPSVVTKRSESSTTAGFGLVFIDDNGGGQVDTIRILIPEPKPVVMPVKEEPKEEKKFLDIATTDTVKDKKEQIIENKEQIKENKPAVVEEKKEGIVTKAVNPCAAVAEESDFFKLRKNMAGKTDNEGMIAEAKKYFKLKCFTTQQIRNLGAMFLDDGGKYRFFDAAYEYVSDIENFPSLQAELKDTYYINRFTAMLR